MKRTPLAVLGVAIVAILALVSATSGSAPADSVRTVSGPVTTTIVIPTPGGNRLAETQERLNAARFFTVSAANERKAAIAYLGAVHAQNLQREAARSAAARKAREEAQARRVTPATTPATTPSRSEVPTPSSGAVAHGGVCGGDLPPCWVVQRESRFSPTAQNPSSTASGLYQFLDSTWAGYGGYAKARLAPVSVQVAKARIVWAGGRGCSHWSACG